MSDVQAQTQPPIPPEGGVPVPPVVQVPPEGGVPQTPPDAGQPPVPEQPVDPAPAENADQTALEAQPLTEVDHVNMLMWVHGYMKHMLARFEKGLHPELDHTKEVEKTLREHLEKI